MSLDKMWRLAIYSKALHIQRSVLAPYMRYPSGKVQSQYGHVWETVQKIARPGYRRGIRGDVSLTAVSDQVRECAVAAFERRLRERTYMVPRHGRDGKSGRPPRSLAEYGRMVPITDIDAYAAMAAETGRLKHGTTT
jgi:hypothetical protein